MILTNKMEEFYLINPEVQTEFDISDWPEIDLFNHWDHATSYSQLSSLLENAWEKTPYNTLKLLFYLRNCHDGRGEREQFYQGVRWFMKHHPEQILANFHLLPQFGYWKDLLNLWDFKNELLRAYIVYSFCRQLKTDLQQISQGAKPSLAAKWAPTEKGSYDRKWGFVGIFCEQLEWSRKMYRQNISKLRDILGVTERLASDRRWGEMDFPEIPVKSRLLFHNTLQKYCGQRYEKWCRDRQLTSSTVFYDIMAMLRDEQQIKQADSKWNELNKSFNDISFGDIACVCNNSPSMKTFGYFPINVAMALSLLISSHSEQFRNKVITFSEQPKLVDIIGTTPTEQVRCLKNLDWGYSINIKAVLQLFIEKKMVPKQLFIFSNRDYHNSQFPHRYEDDHQELIAEFEEHNLNPPEKIYFWNLGGSWGSCSFNLDYHQQGLIIINGFTHELFTTITQTGRLYPWLILNKLLNSDLYSQIQLI